MSNSRSRSSSSCSGSSNISMPLLEKEVEDDSLPVDGGTNPPVGSADPTSSTSATVPSVAPSVDPSSSALEYEFRIQLLNESDSGKKEPSTNAEDDSPPPISPSSTAFDPYLREGQVKIIRMGDTMHVMTFEHGGRPSITSYAKPLSSSWHDHEASSQSQSTTSRRPDLSPLRTDFKFDGESAIRTISRYCFPSCSDTQLDHLTLQEVLSAAQILTEKWVNARDSGLDETQRSFLKTQFIPSKLETVLLKDWETVCEIFEAHHEWKEDQLMFGIEPPTVVAVNYRNASCLKTLPRVSRVTAKKRKELLKNYEPFVDLGQRVDLRGLRRKRGSNSTFLLSSDKISALLEKSQYYGTRSSSNTTSGSDVLTSLNKKTPKKQEQQKSPHKMTVGPKSAQQKGIKSKMGSKNISSDNNNTLNPRRDKPMAKIRSQVRKVNRLARLNGESFHEAALTLSKNSGLGTTTTTDRRTDDGATTIITVQSGTVNNNHVSCSSGTQDSVPPTSAAGIVGNNNLETELDLGLGGVCFDADVAELTNSVMDGNVLEDLDNLVQNPSVFNHPSTSSASGPDTSGGGGNSMVEALHAGIDFVRGEEFAENFGAKNFQDIIVSSMEVDEDDDGLLDAIDTTLSLENLIDQPSLSTTNSSAVKATDIFDMTGLSASEQSAFDSLATTGGQQQQQQRQQFDLQGQSAAPGQVIAEEVSKETAGAGTNPKAIEKPLKTEVNNEKDKAQSRVNQSGNLDDKETSSSNPHNTMETDKIETKQETDPMQDDHDDNDEHTEESEPVSAKKPKLDTRSRKRVVRSRKSAPADMDSNRGELPSRRDRKISAKKAEALLNCTLTGNYWQIPENKCPTNRPKRANAGALMATKSSTRNRDRDSSETRTTGDKKKEKSATPTAAKETKGAKRAPRTAARSNSSKVWCKKYSSDAYTNSPITPDGMIVSKQTALRSIISIPDSICPTSHEEFLLKHRRCFDEEELKEIYELMGKARPKIEASSKKSGMDRYLKKLTTKPVKAPSPPAVPAELPEIKTEPPVDPKVEQQPAASSETISSLPSLATSGPAATVAAVVVPPTKPTPVTAPAPKPKAYSARSKRFEEDEKSEIVKLEGNQILVDGNLIVNINHEDYIREKDFEIPYDDHEFLTTSATVVKETTTTVTTTTTEETTTPSENVENKETVIPPRNIVCSSTSKLPYCALGCVCHSLHPSVDPKDSSTSSSGNGETNTKHCGKVKCMLECSCNASLNTDDADIRSRLRPRVSMLDWNTRLNNYEAYISPDKDGGDQRPAMSQYAGGGGRFKRNVIAPKRNSDFISHSASKKLEGGIRPLTRQAATTKLSPFKTIGNRLQRMKQRQHQQQQQLLRPLKHTNSNDERRVIRLKKNNAGADDNDDVRKSKLGDRGPRSRAGYSSESAKPKRKLVPGVDYSLEGTGPRIPAELMARFAPFMEIRYCPKPDKLLPLVSESEDESSDDDENDDEYASLANLLNQASSSVMKPEDSIPVIVSYRSCQEGLSDDVICPPPCPTQTS